MHTTILASFFAMVSFSAAKPVNFTIFAAQPNTQFWDIPINAIDGRFQIFKPLDQACPEPNKECTKTTHTIIVGDDRNGTLALNSMIPGGQDIFITKDGLVGFKKVGDRAIPDGAIAKPVGFTYVKPISRWQELGMLVYGNGNFSLCGPEDPVFPSYTLYIETANRKLSTSDCTPIEIGARYTMKAEQVWAYN